MTAAMDALPEDLDSRLDSIGWGLFLLLSGAVLLVPALPDGTWLAGIGAILIALSAIRASTGLRVSAFWAITGVALLAGGLATMVAMPLPWFALLLVAWGCVLIVDELRDRRRLG